MDNPSENLGRFARTVLSRDAGFGQLLGVVLNVGLVLILALLSARLFWLVMSPTAFVATPSLPIMSGDAASGTSLVADIRVLERFNPFSRALEGQPDLVVQDDETPETTLNLQIKSLIASTGDPAQSVVRIQTPDNTVSRYQLGDEVVSGVRVQRILSDRVILDRNGQREALLMDEVSVLDRVDINGEPIVDPTPSTNIRSGRSGDGGSTSNAIETYRVSSVDRFYRQLTVRWQIDDDGQRRLVIQPASDPVLLSEVGLLIGDELVSLNGFTLAEDSMGDIYPEIRSASALNVTLRRNNEIKTLVIEIGENDE